MPTAHIIKDVDINKSFRVAQMAGIFDLPLEEKSKIEFQVDMPIEEKDWNIGLIHGPSGCGKTTIGRELFGDNFCNKYKWSKDKSIIDDFPTDLSVKEVGRLFNAVGFSSPPSWVRPFHCLSNGEQFRVILARVLATKKDLVVFDEFTSVVDRTVACIASNCISKEIRNQKRKFIALSCHSDITEWLQPDWIYLPHLNQFNWRLVRRRPEIKLEIKRVHHSAWRLFAKHHYLRASHHSAAKCFVAFWNDKPVCFLSILYFPHPRKHNIYRAHRHVVLPDYQGVGIGNKMEAAIASCYKTLGKVYQTPTSHPAKIASLNKSPNWQMTKKPTNKQSKNKSRKVAYSSLSPDLCRLQATFKYAGPPFPDKKLAAKMLS